MDRHETLLLRLEVGHKSVLLAEPNLNLPSAHTHQWTVFVRGQNGTSLDPSLIQKVVFQLHHDFPNPKRVVCTPPFEVTETGYAGFMIPIYILFSHSKLEHYMEYDMNLKYEPKDENKETRTIEFKDPKPDLRSRLLRAGAEIISNKSSKTQSGSDSFQDLFGETIKLSSQSTINEKVNDSSSLAKQYRPPSSPSVTNGIPKKIRSSDGRSSKNSNPDSGPSKSGLHDDHMDIKRRKSKEIHSHPQISPPAKKPTSPGHGIGNKFSQIITQANGTAQSILDASKLPPPVSPIHDCCGPVFPSTSSISKDESKNRAGKDYVDTSKKAKLLNKIRRKDGTSSTETSSMVRNNKTLQNGTALNEKVKKRRNDKSDSGLDSDYSSGVHTHSPGVSNGHNASITSCGGGALFSPPDSVRSLDTLQESPASAGSSSSTTSIRLSNAKNASKDGLMPATSADVSDQDRLHMLVLLQHKIMTLKERRIAQSIADLISSHASFDVTSNSLQFNLCSLDHELIQRLLRLFDSQI